MGMVSRALVFIHVSKVGVFQLGFAWLLSNWQRDIGNTRVGFGRTEVSPPPSLSSRRDLKNGHGCKGMGAQYRCLKFDLHDCFHAQKHRKMECLKNWPWPSQKMRDADRLGGLGKRVFEPKCLIVARKCMDLRFGVSRLLDSLVFPYVVGHEFEPRKKRTPVFFYFGIYCSFSYRIYHPVGHEY